MAYLLWRVFVKKYSKVRLGIRSLPVIPAERALPEKEETWTLASEQQDPCGFFDDVPEPRPKECQQPETINARASSDVVGENVDASLPRSQETRKSKTKKVKSYLRKCKDVLSKGDEAAAEKKRQENCTSWYLEESQSVVSAQDSESLEHLEKYTELSEDRFPEDERDSDRVSREVEEDSLYESMDTCSLSSKPSTKLSEDALARLLEEDRRIDYERGSKTSVYEDASELFDELCLTTSHDDEDSALPTRTATDYDDETENLTTLDTLSVDDVSLNKCDSSDTLIADTTTETAGRANVTEVERVADGQEDVQVPETESDSVEEEEVEEDGVLASSTIPGNRGDVATLVRNLLGPIYGEGVINLLIRQARDILVCAYHGNLESFVKSYLSPAADLLAELKCIASETGNESVTPHGWPLTLGDSGLVLQLGELEASALRFGECYLCVRSAVATASTAALASPVVASESVERNTVEIALVWRETSMRAPGILGWDREDEFMDWREASLRVQGTTETVGASQSTGKLGRSRRRSREETRARTSDSGRSSSSSGGETSGNVRDVEIAPEDKMKSFERTSRQRLDNGGHASTKRVVKSKSASNVVGVRADHERPDAEADGPTTRARSGARGHPATTTTNVVPACLGGGGGEEARGRVRRYAKVISNATMEKWKDSAKCETRSKALAPQDLKTPLRLDEVIVAGGMDVNGELEERLRNVRHPDEVNDDDLPAYINTLLVTVERKIERVSIDDLTFPCPACRNVDVDDPLLGCRCAVGDEDGRECRPDYVSSTNEESARSFEIAGIKHIDSDDEEEVRMGFGTRKRIDDVTPPRAIHDVPDHVLESGLMLPGYTDDAGRPVIEYVDDASKREILSDRELASFLLYLARVCSHNRTKDGFTLVVRGASTNCLGFIDRVLLLVQNKINVSQVLAAPEVDVETPANSALPLSHVKVTIVEDESLNKHINAKERSHDQAQWIAFYKEYDTLMTEWHTVGRRLAYEMSELKDRINMSGTLTSLSRLLTDPTLRRTTRDAEETIKSLEERATALLHIEDVRLAVKRARRLVEEVGKAATRLESSFESRRATIRNLAVLRSIEDQAHEVLSWFRKKGDDVLSKHAQHAPTTLNAARLHEREFEKFYFTSMRHLDKGSDLAEAASASGLRELAKSLKQHLRGFGARLEDRREYLEDTSRCCLLQDRAREWARDACDAAEKRNRQFLAARPPPPAEHFAEMISLAEKLGNDDLIEQCHVARSKCAEALELARTSPGRESPARGRSPTTSEATTLWDDGIAKRASWDDSDSNVSYVCPTENVGSPASNGRPMLDNIVELRESAEQLLDCSPPRTPPRSPAARRLSKPPVNSHLHRAASIAPGMKAKKTILLIMREMIQTERDYVKSLEYIIENYIPELVRDDIPQALRGQRNVIFGNVEKIYEFHSVHFLRELEQCEQSPMMVGQCFLRHEKKFYLYALYNKNKPNSDSLMAEYGTAFFKQKQLELKDKMDLASYLLKPVQRMGKYALLLQQLVKAGTDLSEQLSGKNEKNENGEIVKPIVEGEADLRAAEQMVRFQLRHGNDLLAMDSLRDCDVNVKEQGRLLRQNEFLVWQGKGKKCLRQVFLFEDLILFSKARRFPDRKNLDIYIYKHSIKTTDIGLTAVIADSPTKFEIWFRKRKPGDTYTLQCASEEIKKAWTEELSNLLWKQALRNREVRLAEMSSMGIGNKPCLDIRPSADQINDRSISVAQLSKTPRFRNSIAVSTSEDSSHCNRRPHSVISVSSSSSSGGSSGHPTTLNLGLDTSPRPHHRSTTLNSQCSIESGIIADISIVSDDSGDSTERNHWNSSLESPVTQNAMSSTPSQSPTRLPAESISSQCSSNANIASYDQDMSFNL